jgi:predicted DNA-binding transcriptional regulator YafY
MPDTLLRQWEMLRLIPRAPRAIGTAELETRLRDAGYEIDRRSIQRDLQNLAESFPLVCDERHKPYGWSWLREGAAFDVPGMDMNAALAFRMAADYLEHLLPAATRQYLEPQFVRAREKLDDMQPGPIKTWPDKVRAVPPVLPRKPPSVDPTVLETVHEALFREKRVHVTYHRRGESEVREYDATPLALVYREAVAYLVCTLNEHKDIKQLALHRMHTAEVLKTPATAPGGWNLDAYVASGAFGFLQDEAPVKLAALFDEVAAASILESPLGNDQKTERHHDGRLLVRVTARNTTELRAWLSSYGALVEVLEPASLRDEMLKQARDTVARYGRKTKT